MHHYSDDSVARQRLHSTHGFTLLPATEGAHPPMHPESFLHDLGGQHVLPPRSSAVDMSAFTAPSMHPLYDPPPTMYNGPNPLASVPSNPSSTYSWYLPHDLSNDQAVDRDLLCLASPWPSQHQSTTASCVPTSLALSALSTPTNYLDTKPHPPASWMQPHVTSPAATSAPSFATSNRFFTAHHEHVAQPASTYASVTNDAAPPMPSPTQLQGPQGRPPASFHKGVPRSVHTGVGLACAVEPRLSSTSSSADSVDNKKEKRRTQVRDASRRRRAKRKDEETRLRDRIQELMHQIHIMGGPQSVDGVGATIDGASDDAALDAAYQQQLQVVRMLQQKNLQYKEKLAQHEQFARMIQSGIQLLTDDSSATATQLQFLQQQQLTRATASAATPLPPVEPASLTGSAPTNLLATSDLARMLATSSVRDALTKWAKTVAAKCHRDLHVSTWDTRGENVTTNVAMGWQTHVWIPLATSKRREMHVRSHKVVVGANSDECAVKTWEMVTSIAKARRVNPDMKAIEVGMGHACHGRLDVMHVRNSNDFAIPGAVVSRHRALVLLWIAQEHDCIRSWCTKSPRGN
ncbi:hypothetical protein, variant 1 [Aphanomyces invadans]|uniref:BZIP domain-containing protein n=1 Tax=Aphanomyces invadans TaxID=157072 RepID=A0A024UEG1_9STRA|nr:hypothetical protein, variant 1 [Aphanomyces invadans]ETW04595.1 hypothetical protein, variant 1 [Aphanomyces invadans]|eukprot:XP_008866032.1 hypothetical protein, variant 1 [Aphanomyces invadans]